jgi:beta-glucanase (GH16 family)
MKIYACGKSIALTFVISAISVFAQAAQRFTDNFDSFNGSRWERQNTGWPGNLSRMVAGNAIIDRGALKLRHAETGRTGAQVRSRFAVGYGDYTARMQAAGGHAGLDSGFFLYSHSSNDNVCGSGCGSNYWHEIDFEFLSRDVSSNRIHTNLFNQAASGGTSGQAPLDKAGSACWGCGLHDYRISWRSTGITWYIDGRVHRTLKTRIPRGKMRVYMNIWAPNPSSWNVGNIRGSGNQYSVIDRVTVSEL